MDSQAIRLPGRLLQDLQRIIQDFACSLDLDATLDVTLGSLMANMRTEAASVFLLTPDRRELVCRACAGPADLKGMRMDAAHGIAGRAIATGEIQLLRDARNSDNFYGGVDAATGFTTRSLLCCPLQVQERTLGAIEIVNRIPSLDNPDGLFDDVDAQLLGILAATAALALHNATLARELVATETLQHELALARNIQESFLPSFDAQHPIVGLNLAAKNVSGDFFDYMLMPDGRYMFNIGDVSGKGMDAALLMARAHSLYHCLAKTLAAPADILATINTELSEHSTRGMFVTMIGGIYDPRTKQVTLANAGHVPAIQHKRNGGFALFESRSLPLGILPDQVFEEVSFSLAEASLYLYTDGLSEGLARVLKQPDDPGNLQTLISTYQHLPRQQRLQQFAQEASWLDSGPRSRGGNGFDDLTILLIEDASQPNAETGKHAAADANEELVSGS
ncbi:MAG TPA: GAF domain-containing SpoIIE family protein phosphatase [Pseudomonadales bacterium]